MKKKTKVSNDEKDFRIDLTFHSVSAPLISEFAEKIVKPYYEGNLNAAFQDLMHKALQEQAFVLSHITHIRTSKKIESYG